MGTLRDTTERGYFDVILTRLGVVDYLWFSVVLTEIYFVRIYAFVHLV